MSDKLRLLVLSSLTWSLAASAPAEFPPAADAGQLGVPISWIRVPGSDDLFLMAQRTRDGILHLTPNEAFFPKLGLVATGAGMVADVQNLNGRKSFARIEKWDNQDVAEWGLFLENSGELQVRVWMTAVTSHGRFTLQLGKTAVSFSTKPTQDQPATVTVAKFEVDKPGQYSLKLTCDDPGADPALHSIEVSGGAARDGSVLRKRWRPAAAHAKFSSSLAPKNMRLWVIEMDAKPGTLSFYSPITTPFGYYGPTWRADGTVNTGFNFSLWSFRRGKTAPPVAHLSHLLAVGNPKASFGGFDHEGTGVKIRNWEPLSGRQGQRQVLALRVEPGATYDTYYSYFYLADEQRWKLFGSGNKYNHGKPLKSLTVGSFVEVPGPPPVQRTGPYQRVMRYRGWIMDQKGKWHPLDQMTHGNVNVDTGLNHTDRGVTDDGWFYLQTGGWTFRKPNADRYVRLAPAKRNGSVEYLDRDDIAFLTTVPSQIGVPVLVPAGNRIRGSYSLRGGASDPVVVAHWGPADALTFAERWENQVTLQQPHEGENQFVIENVPTDEVIHVRLLLSNSEGKFWTPATAKAEPIR